MAPRLANSRSNAPVPQLYFIVLFKIVEFRLSRRAAMRQTKNGRKAGRLHIAKNPGVALTLAVREAKPLRA